MHRNEEDVEENIAHAIIVKPLISIYGGDIPMLDLSDQSCNKEEADMGRRWT